MSVPVIFLASLVMLFINTAVAMRSKNPKVLEMTTAISTVLVILVIVCVAIGLWEAWSPWELARR